MQTCHPKCYLCPIAEYCNAFKVGYPDKYPIRKKVKGIPHYKMAVAIIWRDKKFYIQKRETNKMLGGLWEFPGGIVNKGENMEEVLKKKFLKSVELNCTSTKKPGLSTMLFHILP